MEHVSHTQHSQHKKAEKSTNSVKDTILRHQDKHQRQQQQQQHHIIMVGFLKKENACCSFSGPDQNKRSWVFFSDGLLNVKDAPQMDSILHSGLEVKLRQTLADVIIEN